MNEQHEVPVIPERTIDSGRVVSRVLLFQPEWAMPRKEIEETLREATVSEVKEYLGWIKATEKSVFLVPGQEKAAILCQAGRTLSSLVFQRAVEVNVIETESGEIDWDAVSQTARAILGASGQADEGEIQALMRSVSARLGYAKRTLGAVKDPENLSAKPEKKRERLSYVGRWLAKGMMERMMAEEKELDKESLLSGFEKIWQELDNNFQWSTQVEEERLKRIKTQVLKSVEARYGWVKLRDMVDDIQHSKVWQGVAANLYPQTRLEFRSYILANKLNSLLSKDLPDFQRLLQVQILGEVVQETGMEAKGKDKFYDFLKEYSQRLGAISSHVLEKQGKWEEIEETFWTIQEQEGWKQSVKRIGEKTGLPLTYLYYLLSASLTIGEAVDLSVEGIKEIVQKVSGGELEIEERKGPGLVEKARRALRETFPQASKIWERFKGLFTKKNLYKTICGLSVLVMLHQCAGPLISHLQIRSALLHPRPVAARELTKEEIKELGLGKIVAPPKEVSAPGPSYEELGKMAEDVEITIEKTPDGTPIMVVDYGKDFEEYNFSMPIAEESKEFEERGLALLSSEEGELFYAYQTPFTCFMHALGIAMTLESSEVMEGDVEAVVVNPFLLVDHFLKLRPGLKWRISGLEESIGQAAGAVGVELSDFQRKLSAANALFGLQPSYLKEYWGVELKSIAPELTSLRAEPGSDSGFRFDAEGNLTISEFLARRIEYQTPAGQERMTSYSIESPQEIQAALEKIEEEFIDSASASMEKGERVILALQSSPRNAHAFVVLDLEQNLATGEWFLDLVEGRGDYPGIGPMSWAHFVKTYNPIDGEGPIIRVPVSKIIESGGPSDIRTVALVNPDRFRATLAAMTDLEEAEIASLTPQRG